MPCLHPWAGNVQKSPCLGETYKNTGDATGHRAIDAYVVSSYSCYGTRLLNASALKPWFMIYV